MGQNGIYNHFDLWAWSLRIVPRTGPAHNGAADDGTVAFLPKQLAVFYRKDQRLEPFRAGPGLLCVLYIYVSKNNNGNNQMEMIHDDDDDGMG